MKMDPATDQLLICPPTGGLSATAESTRYSKPVLRVLNPFQNSSLRAKSFMLILLSLFFQSFQNPVIAQTAADSNYTKVITERAAKIVNGLQITDSSHYYTVRTIIVDQYRSLSTIHDNSKAKAEQVKRQDQLVKEQRDSLIKILDSEKTVLLTQQHGRFIAQLNKELTSAQVEKVKDGLTYNVLNVTYNAYQQMLPQLSPEQKDKIYNWLVEARELAMDAESSEKKHAWFGKYKGRINNYLSAQGIDMKKAEADWAERRKAAAVSN